jgi:hypothetical protein
MRGNADENEQTGRNHQDHRFHGNRNAGRAGESAEKPGL